jgi:hypothetical protein
VGQERLGPSYFFIPLVLGPLKSLVLYVPSLRYTRGLGWRMHCGVEVTESSTNKQHHLSFGPPSNPPTKATPRRVRPDLRRPGRRQGHHLRGHQNHLCSPVRRTKKRHPDPPHRADTPRLRRAPRRPNLSSTTSTSAKVATNSLSSSATSLSNMVNSPGRFYAELASLALSGTSLLPSPPSLWSPRNTSPARSPLTLTMTMTPTMTLPPPMNRMIEPEYPFMFVGSVQGYLDLVSLLLFS